MAANYALMNERTVFTGVERAGRTLRNAPVDLKLRCLSKMTGLIDVNQHMMSKRSAFMSDMNDLIGVKRDRLTRGAWHGR